MVALAGADQLRWSKPIMGGEGEKRTACECEISARSRGHMVHKVDDEAQQVCTGATPHPTHGMRLMYDAG